MHQQAMGDDDLNKPTTSLSFNNSADSGSHENEMNSFNFNCKEQHFGALLNDQISEQRLSSPMPTSTIEHRKRHRRRLMIIWRGELVGRRKMVYSSQPRETKSNRQNGSNKNRQNTQHSKMFSLAKSILVLVQIILFAQFFVEISAISSNTAMNPNLLKQKNHVGQKENTSAAEHFANNIWKIESPTEIAPIWEWQAFLKKPKQNQAMCHIWNAGSPSELCARNRWHRIRRMRELSLFAKCPEGYANLQLIDIFQLDWREIRTEDDLLSHSEHLRHGPEGQGCLLGAADSNECINCFNKLNLAFERLEKAFWSFSNLLQRFDCRLVTKQQPKVELSATRPFSPNTTCYNCAEWYRKWLLINLVGIWKKRPCINWCYYTQLACPHLATNKVVEFAGHPVFLCRDQRLTPDQKDSLMLTDCSCFHPCDLIRNRIAQFGQNKTKSTLEGVDRNQSFDFFHVSTYCQNRETICTK